MHAYEQTQTQCIPNCCKIEQKLLFFLHVIQISSTCGLHINLIFHAVNEVLATLLK